MNIYDTKQIKCYRCGKFIGEVDYDVEIICPKCGSCSDPFPSDEIITNKIMKSREIN